jgi:hypothetical protein
MGTLGKPDGLFSLLDSDRSVGSFLSRRDIKEILSVSDNDLKDISFMRIDNFEFADERIIQKLWYHNKIPNAILPDKSSLDELILIAIIKQAYPQINIERQVRVKRFQLDLKLNLNGKEIFIEFDGPSHFTPSQYRAIPSDPFRKKNIVEDETGIEVVNWAYWIQRCTSNVKALFETDIQGYGVLWSTEIHFGHFFFNDSAEMIETITKRFNAIDNTGYGYFYGGNTRQRNNPEHPIIEKIKTGKANVETILPRGYKDRNYWLPDKLKNLP